jgi:uncharacterized caspase-like protein
MRWRDMPNTVGRLLRLAAILWLAAFPAHGPAHGQELRGVALVIGNGAYEHLSPLANPGRDADAIEDLLSRLGFDSVRRSDRDAVSLARDVERFVEDAADADVAVLYYAGHGIEAGGENWLVPVDADISALEDASARLVPLSAILERLRKAVPVAIVLLDACRDNPFPQGAVLRQAPGSEAVAVSAGGLAETRGARALAAAPAPAIDNLGMVVGFAAEPGRQALDGAEGGNSPYAAAVIRHLSAMAGEEFGTVMSMVAEEVYLKTAGRQRPWVNESLRRLLYFGAAPEPVEGAEGAILAERRQLLLSIAALPDIGRRQIEKVAADGNVPMDAVYGMLRALGAEAPSDPARLDAMLRAQSERLAEIMAERAVLSRSDPEIVRLAALAGTAIEEGALATAIDLHAQAKARVAELSRDLDDVESQLRERRIEFARVYAESAAALELAFDYRRAAIDYRNAYDEVERWDDALAWDYLRRAVIASYRTGEYEGDAAVLEQVVAGRATTFAAAARLASPVAMAEAKLQIANALQVLGRQRGSPEMLREAAGLYEEAVPAFAAGSDVLGVRRARNNLASALTALGVREAETATLERAVAIHRELAGEFSVDEEPREWATARINLAAALSVLGERDGSTATMREVADIFRGVLERVTRESDPILWAMTHSNLAGALSFIGRRDGPAGLLVESVRISQAALDVFTRQSFPLYWASITNNIGNSYLDLGRWSGDETILQGAIISFEDALEEWRRDRVPGDWALATNNLANAVKSLAVKRGDLDGLKRSVDLYRAIMEVWTRQARPLDWGTAQNNMGDALYLIGRRTGDVALLRASLAAFEAAQQEWTYERLPYDWAVAENNRGGTLVELGALTRDPAMIRDGMAAIRAAWKFDRDMGETSYDRYYADRLDEAEAKLSATTGETR